MPAKAVTALRLFRNAAVAPHLEPVSAGVPFARGVLRQADQIAVVDGAGRPVPSHAAALARWPDGSVRWALLDLLVDAGAQREERVEIRLGEAAAPPAAGIGLQEQPAHYAIDTGAVRLAVPRDVFAPFATLCCTTAPEPAVAGSTVVLEDARGRPLVPSLERLAVETHTALRLTLAGDGEWRAPRGRALCRFAARLSLFGGTGLVRLDLTLHNPRRARHRRGRWDLGDPGSILFRCLAVDVRLTPAPLRILWRPGPDEPEQAVGTGRIELYQASSGGERWTSRTHVDRSGCVPLPFLGCRIADGERVAYRERVSPVVTQIAAGGRLSAACTKFWQRFPSALSAGPQGLSIGLFPRQAGAAFELQGGEQATHTVFFLLEMDAGRTRTDLAWVHDPLVPCFDPEYVATSDAFAHFVPADRDPHLDYRDLTRAAVEGPRSFFAKREAIDEYGWRNFGDTWADHEDVYFSGAHPVVSHYNNQYDLVYGFLLHFARGGDPRWFELAADLARHVMDIDLYHTAADKPAYNGGLFWHTAHYEDAGRATHRSYSRDSPRSRAGLPYGGGPSCEHNYTTGLLYLHCLTGDPRPRAAVLQLADWVLRMDDGSESLLAAIDPGPTGLASYTRTFDYHGPGRGAGNSVNALLDAHWLVGAPHYLAKAEALIARCIHPRDDPAALGLDDAETRWSYTVFLQALGKYLDRKCELGENDAAFAFARASLTRYAEWMLAHETPFTTRFDRVEYPTETWPAQDIRKSCVFDYAAQYGPAELREPACAAAERFFAESLRGVLAFETRACTRPLAILLANGVQRASVRVAPERPVPPYHSERDFGAPSGFRPQKARLRARLRTASGWLALARAALRPQVWWRLATGRIW